jgi:TolA-binding protein
VLLRLSRLALDPTNPDKDDRDAAAYLDRLIAQYPRSPSVPEARRLGSLLQQVGRLQQELRRQQGEVERLRRTLQREQQEMARLREERERLRQIDVELERPRLLQNPSTSAPSVPRLPE